MRSNRAKASLVSITIVAMALSGCVTTQQDRIGANDGTDACYQYRVALDSTGNYYAEDMLKGAAIGAGVGALTGVLASGNLKGALIGAAAGAALGTLGGYWNSKAQQGRDQAILGVMNDLDAENQNLNRTQVALDQLVNCRRAEIARVKADYKAKRIGKPEAEQRMALIRAQLDKDYAIASSINQNIVKRRDEYLIAADNIEPGSAEKIRTKTAVKAQTSKKKKAKQTTTAGGTPASQVVQRTNTAFETSERINATTSSIQQIAQKEATLDAV
ncbi:YMGG-like glycine zipper-containing protein [Azospirillum sp. B2RO_4]|uniref:YMGG-like glycine zipper-containing protein n=1 Tax=Azospirillum sp. B2RO_4 TaxID=3027796 RepID=UPI003DA8C6B7